MPSWESTSDSDDSFTKTTSTATSSTSSPTTTKAVSTNPNRLTWDDDPLDGLSKFHRSILLRRTARQRFVTGRYPLTVKVTDNPTRKWLDTVQTELLVNGTTAARSLASLDRFQWLDRHERDNLVDSYAMLSLELLAVIYTERPGYLQIMDSKGAGASAAKTMYNIAGKPLQSWTTDRLWVTGFSLASSRGIVKSLECDTGVMTAIPTAGSVVRWPNEVHAVPRSLLRRAKEASLLKHGWLSNDMLVPGVVRNQLSGTSDMSLTSQHLLRKRPLVRQLSSEPLSGTYRDALLVCDGFLVPGKDRGGLYVVHHPGNAHLERTVSLTSDNNDRWFYHRAVWVDLTGDGRLSVLAARCKVSTLFDREEEVGIMSGIQKSSELVWLECPEAPPGVDDFDPLQHLPWTTHVLTRGPDVMFSIADLDSTDETIEVLASEFFTKKVSLYSIRRGRTPAVTFSRCIDDKCGPAFSSVLADLDGNQQDNPYCSPIVVDHGSTVPSLHAGDTFSHLLVTSHECSFVMESTGTEQTPGSITTSTSITPDGGSLFAYRVPTGSKDAWRTLPWERTTVATGFKVKGQLGNMIAPGAPGFVYCFHARRQDARSGRRPMIAVAGDCAESAYIFRPSREGASSDRSTRYKLMVEIQCGATVGSIGVGYDDFTTTEQESGYAKLYIPCYEKDKIHVFALGSGVEDDGW